MLQFARVIRRPLKQANGDQPPVQKKPRQNCCLMVSMCCGTLSITIGALALVLGRHGDQTLSIIVGVSLLVAGVLIICVSVKIFNMKVAASSKDASKNVRVFLKKKNTETQTDTDALETEKMGPYIIVNPPSPKSI